MESLYLLIPLSVAAILGIVVVLWWATSGGQFDDLVGPAQQVLMDDDSPDKGAKLPDEH
jgi:cbb3-type cytochrome oxidase maturation protein